MTKGVSLAYLQRNREAMILLPGVLLLAESNGLIVTEARARLNISQFGIVDQPAQSLAVARIGMERAQKLGLRLWETLLAGNSVMAALHTGDWDWAIKTCTDVMRDSPLASETSELDAYPAIMLGLRGDGGERGLLEYRSVYRDRWRIERPAVSDAADAAGVWLRLMHGDLQRAAETTISEETFEPVYAAKAYRLGGHAALWLGDRERAGKLVGNSMNSPCVGCGSTRCAVHWKPALPRWTDARRRLSPALVNSYASCAITTWSSTPRSC